MTSRTTPSRVSTSFMAFPRWRERVDRTLFAGTGPDCRNWAPIIAIRRCAARAAAARGSGHPERERLCRDRLFLDAGRRSVSAAITAMQLKTDPARHARSCDGIGMDFVAPDIAVEHAAHLAVRQRHEDVEDAAAGAAGDRFMVGALGPGEAHDVIVTAVAGEVELAHGILREGHRATPR